MITFEFIAFIILGLYIMRESPPISRARRLGFLGYPSDYQQRNGAITPVYDINNYGRLSPASGKQSPMFPRAKSELSRPPSQNNMATQTDSRLGYDTYLPPPSPARIDRSFTMYPIEGERMDPFTKQYYERLWRNEFAPKDPDNRKGRAGGRWRHVHSVIGQTGSNIAFIEGL
ncbi:hypothetical protein KUTeg_012920 [Tegillarca granosa]|uniref:Uncharacterized protein n=1 Tax=Tegillarca granosa TaxID=220873 RepID=A0ABQ9ES62_TEGGR|nr:hypothetical protein KUTeg_012920 [Tegillarca granosa]